MRFFTLMLALVAVGSVVACGGSTAEDRARLELLKNDPLFDYAPPGQTTDEITSALDILADGDDPISDTTRTSYSVSYALGSTDDHLAIMREIEALMIDHGWRDVFALCLDSSIELRGVKEFDGFVASGGPWLFAEFHFVDAERTPGPGLRLGMSAPYHTEAGRPIEGHPPD